jgi:hypothetical protein
MGPRPSKEDVIVAQALNASPCHDYCNILNSLVCKFQEFSGFTLVDSLNSLNAATGMGWTQEDLQKIGERITNLQKLLNIRYGWKKADDFAYPKRFMEPKPDGKVAGKVPTGLDQVIEEYPYAGWDENSDTDPGKLKELGLDDIPAPNRAQIHGWALRVPRNSRGSTMKIIDEQERRLVRTRLSHLVAMIEDERKHDAMVRVLLEKTGKTGFTFVSRQKSSRAKITTRSRSVKETPSVWSTQYLGARSQVGLSSQSRRWTVVPAVFRLGIYRH